MLLANPIGLTILAIGVLAGAAYLVYQNWDKIGPWFETLWAGVTTTFQGVADFVTGIFTGDFDKAAAGLRTIFDGLGTYMSTFWGGVRGTFETFLGFLDNTFGTNFKGAFNAIETTIGNVLRWIEENLADRLKGAFDKAYNFVSPIIDAISNVIDRIRSGIEWIQSLDPSSYLPSFGGSAPAPAGAAPAASAAPMGRTAPGRGGRVAPQQAPDVDTIFGPGGRYGGAPGAAARETAQAVDVGGKMVVEVRQDRSVFVKTAFNDPRIRTGPDFSTGISNALLLA